MKKIISVLICLSLHAGLLQSSLADPPPSPSGFYSLDQFGPVSSAGEISATYAKALPAVAEMGGGILSIGYALPSNAPLGPNPFPNVTVVDFRQGTLSLQPPVLTGILLSRVFKTLPGQSSPHWTYHPMVSVENNVIRGSNSYMDWLQADVEAGEARRFYVPTIRALFPGMFINAHGHTSYQGGVARLHVSSLGYDSEKQMHYFVADTPMDHKAGAILHNKTHVSAAKAMTHAHTEAQSVDMLVDRRHYAQGDAYLYGATFRYTGDVHSAAGDENGVLYAAFVESKSNIFRGTVETTDEAGLEVVYQAKGAQNALTLGTGRPLINLNPDKWLTLGSVVIVRPGSFTQTPDEAPGIEDPVFEGKSYPTLTKQDPATGKSVPVIGGLIRASADAPWTEAVVGRYFAVDEENERVPKGQDVRRWYRIVSFNESGEGTKEIRIERKWWGAWDAGAPTLYHEENYSRDGSIKPLSYVIAPGSNVADVTAAIPFPYQSGFSERTLRVSPFPDADAEFGFAPGDAIEQAVGPDPFKPVPFRVWMWDQVPGAWPAAVLDVASWGSVTRDRVLSARGGKAGGPVAFDDVFLVDAPVGSVLDFGGIATKAAVTIEQRNRSAPVKWLYAMGEKEAVLQVDHKTGGVSFTGGQVSAGAGFTRVGGLSGGNVPAKNLRGVNVPVPQGSSSLEVAFPNAESDAEYAVFIETTWLTDRMVAERKPGGFNVKFSDKAPADAKVHWLIVR